MSEILLQAIVEKLQSLEQLLKNNKADKNQETLKGLQDEIQRLSVKTLSADMFNELKADIDERLKKIERPSQNQILHKHHLHKGMWVSLVLFITCILFLWLWINTINDKKQFQANDIKYRVPKVSGNESLLKVLYHTDSLYNLDPDQMQKWVVQQEDLLIQQTKMLQFADEKKKNEVVEMQKKIDS